MANKFAENVKRIVGEPRDTTVTPSLDERGGIESTRGIGSQTPGGKTTSQSGAVGDSAKDDKDGKTDTKTKDEAQNNGTTSSPGDLLGGGGGGFTKDAGKKSIEDIVDNGGDGQSTKSGTLKNFQGNGILGDSLRAITATDCASGKDLTTRLDGFYEPQDATTWDDGTPKTPAWPDPTVPPEKPGFESGKWWLTDSTVNQEMAVLYDMDAIGAGIVSQNQGAAGQTGGPGTVYGPNSFGDYYVFDSYNQVSSTQWEVILFQSDSGGNPLGPDFKAFNVNQQDCISNPPTIPGITCPASAPIEEQWPEDNDITLTREDGKYVPSVYDPDATVEYSGQQTSHVNVCFGSGRTGTIRIGKDGGTVVYETSSANGPPTGTVFYYDSNGELSGIGDSGSLAAYLPGPND